MRITSVLRSALLPALCLISTITFAANAKVVNFADIALDAESAWKGPVPEESGEEFEDAFGSLIRHGMVRSGDVQFINRYNFAWQSWSGFAFSNSTDNTTPGFLNDTSAFPGSGAGDANYSVAFGYVQDLDPASAEQRESLPYFDLPTGYALESLKVTNTTYAALIMLDGDENGFAKQFGGATGTDPDFFSLHVYGTDAEGALLPESVEVPLADYRFEDPVEDFVLSEWQELDLSPLSDARRVYFNFNSSDVGAFGINTPAYVAIDDIVLRASRTEDLDGDGQLTADDVDLLCASVASGSSDLGFDLNDDGAVNGEDIGAFLDAANRLPGDTNFDGTVDFADFLRFANQYEAEGTWSQGDFDCSGTVSFSDFLLLSEHFDTSATAAAVPEPRGVVLAWFVVITLVRCGLRRRRATDG